MLCRHQQTTLGLTSNEMLLYTAAPKSAFLLLVGPLLDRVVTQGEWVFDFDFSVASSMVILATCLLAVGVNLSQFMCLGRCSATAYQVQSKQPCLYCCCMMSLQPKRKVKCTIMYVWISVLLSPQLPAHQSSYPTVGSMCFSYRSIR